MRKDEESKPFKILAIDGGGVKGLFSASLLSRIEEGTGKKCTDYFDMIAGTSTGGLIALGLASGKSAEDLANLYINNGKAIFPTSNYRLVRLWQDKISQFLKQILFFGKYKPKALKKILTNEFGDKTIGELNNLVIIPSFNMIRGITRIFKFPHKEGGFFRDGKIKVVDVALATSAAPTYFPVHEIDSELYIDGGVWANNPSLCAITEAIRYFLKPESDYTHIELLSVSCLPGANGWTANERKSRSFIGWTDKLIQASMDGQAYFTDFFLKNNLKLIAPGSSYYRIKSPSLSAPQINVIKLDRADNKAINTLKTLGDQLGYELSNDKDILKFFQTPKTYNI